MISILRKMHRILLNLLFYCLIFFNAHAQSQANNWFFCRNNGISFANGSPANIFGGRVTRMEGASAVSDKNGQLLFYTDGSNVWNKNHSLISSGLNGGSGSSTQAAIIVPKTPDEKEWYIFTADEEGGWDGLQYSVVDMTGAGMVTLLNQRLVSPCSEKVTAVRHCNKKDYWVITHHYGSNAYYAYLVTSSGVNPVPVVSNTGRVHPVTHGTMAGALKASPDGKWLAAATPYTGIELSNFDNNTGIVSGTAEIFQNDNAHHYGVEFSANSTKLYTGISGYWDEIDFVRYSGVFQFDLNPKITAAIIASKVQLAKIGMPSELGFMQRGPDRKIYMAQYQKNYLSVINAPDVAGTNCNYVNSGFTLTYGNEFSLPNMISDYGMLNDSISTSSACVNLPVSFRYWITMGVDSVRWDFGDIHSPVNTSTAVNPLHTYSKSGTYPILLIKFGYCGNDTIRKTITVGNVQVNLGVDTSICEGNSLLLNPHSTGTNTYSWQNGSTGMNYLATTAGTYWVDVSNTANGCIKRDSVEITFKPLPVINLGKDTTLCSWQTLLLDAGNPGANYVWQNGSTDMDYLVNTAGTYWVKVTMNGCSKADTISITNRFLPDITLGPDQFLCPGLTLELSPSPASGYQFLWQDGSSGGSYIVNVPGVYYVTAINSCGVFRDSVVVSTGSCTLYVPSGFTPNGDGVNDEFCVLGTGLVDQFELIIFDRVGQLLFRTNNKSRGWDGKFKGQAQSSGVYVYMVRYTEIGETKRKLIKGTVVLLR